MAMIENLVGVFDEIVIAISMVLVVFGIVAVIEVGFCG